MTFYEIYWFPPLSLRAKWACETEDKKCNKDKTENVRKKKLARCNMAIYTEIYTTKLFRVVKQRNVNTEKQF